MLDDPPPALWIFFEGWTEFGIIGVEWYNVHHHSFRRDGDVAKLKGSVDLSLILEERDSFE